MGTSREGSQYLNDYKVITIVTLLVAVHLSTHEPASKD